MAQKSLPVSNDSVEDILSEPIRYRIDPEVAHSLIGSNDEQLQLRQSDFWDSVGPEYSDIARNIGLKVSEVRATKGDDAASSYLEAATSMLEAISLQDELNKRLAD